MAACFSIMSMRVRVRVCVRVHALPRITLHRRLQETEHPISSCIVYQQVMKGVTFNRYLSH